MGISRQADTRRSRYPLLRRFLAVAIAFGTMGLVPTFAQTSGPGVIYRLAKASAFQRGCFAPCLCPVMEQGTEEGTFVLTPAGSDGLFAKYAVSEVNWTVTLPGGEVRVIGSGTYKFGGEVAVQHELSLDLKVGDNPVQHFDSGLVSGGGDFPRIDITVSINGQYCFDTVFTLDASPVPPDQIHPYRLLRDSTFQRSCSGPCACAPGPQLPITGSFFLVDLGTDPLFTRYSVVKASWLVAADPASTSSQSLPVTGSGTYRAGGEFAVQQEMSLDLMVGQQPPVLFDSGLVPGGGFPRIKVRLINGADTCVTTVIDLDAKPAPVRGTATGSGSPGPSSGPGR